MKLVHTTVLSVALATGTIDVPRLTAQNGIFPWLFGGQGIWWPSASDPCQARTWGAWGGWGQCDTTGVRWREAPCLLKNTCPSKCVNALLEKTSDGCVPSIWGAWGSWGSCNSQTSTKQRSAPCLAGPPTCVGSLVEEKDCLAPQPEPPAPETIWGEWGSWSLCNLRTRVAQRQAPCLAGPPKCTGSLVAERDCTFFPAPFVAPTLPPTLPPTTQPLAPKLHCCGIETTRCNESAVPDVCRQTFYFFQSEKTRALCAFNTLCIKKPEIFRTERFSRFSGAIESVCRSTSIHDFQRCLADSTSPSCRGLNGQIIEQCWVNWKMKDYQTGNILTPTGK